MQRGRMEYKRERERVLLIIILFIGKFISFTSGSYLMVAYRVSHSRFVRDSLMCFCAFSVSLVKKRYRTYDNPRCRPPPVRQEQWTPLDAAGL